MSEPDLLLTKFTVPFVRAQHLPRAHLIEQLNQRCSLPLVLLSETVCKDAKPTRNLGGILERRQSKERRRS
jgi:hypothetical protein